MASKIKNVICVATIKDIHAWVYASESIIQNIDAEKYYLITPDRYVHSFRCVTDDRFEVISENVVAKDFDLSYVESRMPEHCKARAGWYYQQLIKIQSLIALPSNSKDVLLIWDADTIPLKNLNFIHEDKLIYYMGEEYHPPYFQATEKLLGLSKNVSFSFIAQCFPVFREWVDVFVNDIEGRAGTRWFDAILSAANLAEIAGFSEYETMGTFLVDRWPDRILLNKAKWERYGNRIAPLQNVKRSYFDSSLAFVAYEAYDPNKIKGSNSVNNLIVPKNESEFLEFFFNILDRPRAVIQIGANDGIMEDPIYQYLRNDKCNDVFVLLVEPLDYYYKRLCALHSIRPNTMIVKAAAGSAEAVRNFYYIDPQIANEMNGEGPQNNWAHGQGSFFRESVEYWIEQNQFRGSHYRNNIGRYFKSIKEVSVNVFPLKNIKTSPERSTLLVIDVQGAELEVLLGIDWTRRPDWIFFEQDRGSIRIIQELLVAMGYEYVCGSSNVVYGLTETLSQFRRAEAQA